jgi:hypothetical protein
LLSGLILDGILFVYMNASSVISTFRNWDAAHNKAIGLLALAATVLELVVAGVFYGLAGTLATYLALRWTRTSPQPHR